MSLSRISGILFLAAWALICLHGPSSVSAAYLTPVLPTSQCPVAFELQSLRGDRFVRCLNPSLVSNISLWHIPANTSIAPYKIWSIPTQFGFTVDERSGYLFTITVPANRAIVTVFNVFNVNAGYVPPPFAMNITNPVTQCRWIKAVPNLDLASSQDFNVSVFTACTTTGGDRLLYVAQNVLTAQPRSKVEMALPAFCEYSAYESDGINIMVTCDKNEYYCYPIMETNKYNITNRSRYTVACPQLSTFRYRSFPDELYAICVDNALMKVQHPCDAVKRNVSVVVPTSDCAGLEAMAFDPDPMSTTLTYSCFGSGKYLLSPLYPRPILIASLIQCAPPSLYTSYMSYANGVLTISCFSGIVAFYPGEFSAVLIPSRCSYPIDLGVNSVTGDLFQACYQDTPIARIREAQYQAILSEDDCFGALSMIVDSESNSEVFACVYPSDTYRVSSEGPGENGMELVISGDDCSYGTLFADTPRRNLYSLCSDFSVSLVNLDTSVARTIFPANACSEVYQILHMPPFTFFSCNKQGLFAVSDNATSVTQYFVVLNGTDCSVKFMTAHERSNTLFLFCVGKGVWKVNPAIGRASFSQVVPRSICDTSGLKVFGDELVVVCNYNQMLSFPVSAFTSGTATAVLQPTVLKSECPSIINYVKDPRTDTLYSDCINVGIAVSGLNFACYAGTEWRIGVCEPCSVGKYRNRDLITSKETECQLCPAGSVAPNPGSSACEVCGKGFYQVSSFISCKPCALGTYTDSRGATTCSACASGYFGNSTQLTTSHCSGVCSAGFWCGEGSTKSQQMPCGSASVYCPRGSSEPLAVGAGYYGTQPVVKGTVSTQSARQKCEVGQYCDGSGIARPCPPGRFANITGTEECVPCAIGQWSDGVRRNTTGEIIIDAVLGQPILGAVTCEPCAPGSYTAQIGTIVCSLCSPGSSQASTGATTCQGCIPGHSASEAGYGVCALCPVGRATAEPHSISCSLCSPGRYAPLNGSLTCEPCDAGYFSVDFGSVSCERCNPGRFSDTTGAPSCLACTPGSASNATALNQVCPPCPPGTSQIAPAQVSCDPCPPKKYSSGYGSLQCASCPTVTNVERTICSLSPCEVNQEYDSDTGACNKCKIGFTASKGGTCTACPPNTYTPGIGTGCISCNDMIGLSCANGRITVQDGYWAFQRFDEVQGFMVYHSEKCPEGFCSETTLQQEFFQNETAIALGLAVSISHSSQCVFPRLDSTDNILCGACVDGYIPQGDSCVECKEPNGALLFGYLLLSVALVIFLYRSAASESAAGHSVVLMYFAQTAMLEVGPVKGFLQWLRIVNFNGTSGTGSTCLAPMTAYEQYMVSIAMPVFLLCELGIIALLHRVIYAIVKGGPVQRPASMSNVTDTSNLSSSQRMTAAFSDFQWSRYVGGSISILLFCYTQATTSCIRFLDCIDVGDSSVVFTDPTINCRSSEYKRYLIPIVVAIVLYVVLFPILAFAFLVSRHRSFNARAKTIRQRTKSELESPGSTTALASVQDNSLSAGFYMRYGILFQAFAAHAWFWQATVLVRRAGFVLLSVLLTQKPESRGLAFIMLNIASMTLHLYTKPFADEAVNLSETISNLMLLLISSIITAYTPPYPIAAQIILFILIIPTIAFFLLQAIKQNAQLIQSRLRHLASTKSIERKGTVQSMTEGKQAKGTDDKPNQDQLKPVSSSSASKAEPAFVRTNASIPSVRPGSTISPVTPVVIHSSPTSSGEPAVDHSQVQIELSPPSASRSPFAQPGAAPLYPSSPSRTGATFGIQYSVTASRLRNAARMLAASSSAEKSPSLFTIANRLHVEQHNAAHANQPGHVESSPPSLAALSPNTNVSSSSIQL